MITRLFLWLFWACRHRWETIREVPLLADENGVFWGVVPKKRTGTRVHLRCTNCGDVRKRDLI